MGIEPSGKTRKIAIPAFVCFSLPLILTGCFQQPDPSVVFDSLREAEIPYASDPTEREKALIDLKERLVSDSDENNWMLQDVEWELKRIPAQRFRFLFWKRASRDLTHEDIQLLATAFKIEEDFNMPEFHDKARPFLEENGLLLSVAEEGHADLARQIGFIPTLGKASFRLSIETERTVLDSRLYDAGKVDRNEIKAHMQLRRDEELVLERNSTASDPALPIKMMFQTFNGVPTGPMDYHTAWKEALEKLADTPFENRTPLQSLEELETDGVTTYHDLSPILEGFDQFGEETVSEVLRKCADQLPECPLRSDIEVAISGN